VILGTGGKITKLGISPEQEEIHLHNAHRTGQFWCFGTSRSGKTRLMENMIEDDIRQGLNVIAVDPKGDIPLFSKIVQVALEEGRQEDLMFVTPIFPQYSVQFNPLEYYYMSEELVGHILSGVAVGKEPFFFNVAYETSLVIVQSILMLSKHMKNEGSFNLNDVKELVSHTDLIQLHAEMTSIEGDPQAEQLSRDLQKIIDSGQDYYNKVSSSLRVALMELTSGNIGQVVGNAYGNKIIKRLEANGGLILIVHPGSLLTNKAAHTLGKVLISMIQSYVGRVYSSGKIIEPALALYIDEAQNTLYFGIEDLFAKAGGANLWIHAFSQSVNQIYSLMGEDVGKTILDNTNTKIFMRVPDKDTAEYVCQHFGTKKAYSPVLSVGGAMSVREIDKEIIDVVDVLSLQPRSFLMMGYDGRFFGKTKAISEKYIDVEFPNIIV